jgi:hypothetical protein
VAPLSRLLNTRPGLRASALAALLSALVAVGLLAAAPAGAVVTKVEETLVGVQPHSTTFFTPGSEPAAFANAGGSPVVHGENTYAIYWDPKFQYHPDWAHLIDGFMESMGSASGSRESVFAVDTQYTDSTNQPAAYSTRSLGAYTDTTGYPSPGCTDPSPLVEGDAITCLSDKQIRAELAAFISARGLPKGMGTIYYLLTPPGVTVCVDEIASSHCSSNESSPNSFCSYHSAIGNGDANTILYGMIPWSAGGLGDFKLHVGNRTPGYNCQDGGFDPSSKPEAEKLEKAKEKTKPEKEAFEKATNEEKEKLKRAEELEGPHQQEPNQEGCPTSGDGGCDTGLADIIIGQIAAEQQNIVTNPLLNAWQDPKKNELTDECRNFFAPVLGGGVTANELSSGGTLFNQSLGKGAYYLNAAFNLAAYKLSYPGARCITHVNLVPTFTAPNAVNAGEIVGFDGMESNISLDAAYNFPGGGAAALTYATYTWNFGDGTAPVSGYAPGAPTCSAPWLSPCAASAFHSYQYGGTWNVSLTVTDVGGNVATVSHPVTVVGPAPPSPGKEAGGGSSGGSGGSASGGSSAPGGSAPVVKGSTPSPVAAAAVVSRSLRGVKHSGIVVRFSVNEQVAGHIEVLLDRAVAHRLGISGAPAVGLPAGSAPAVVIGKALLITSKGGRSTTVVQLSKRTIARLQRMPKVTLMLRLSVRNADPHAPTTSTLLSVFTLSR